MVMLLSPLINLTRRVLSLGNKFKHMAESELLISDIMSHVSRR